MKIGVPKEIKPQENRVGATPGTVAQLVAAGHEVFVESNAGAGIGVSNEAYEKVGAKILPDADAVFEAATMIVKVKEPQPIECARLKPHHILFTYLHLAPDPEQAKALMASGCTAIAYETVVGRDGGLPLLAPMSEVAGRMATQVGAHCLLKPQGGLGKLMGGVPGVAPAKVVILGGGVAGLNACEIAHGMRADVTVFDRSKAALVAIDRQFGGMVTTLMSTPAHSTAAHPRATLSTSDLLQPLTHCRSHPCALLHHHPQHLQHGYAWAHRRRRHQDRQPCVQHLAACPRRHRQLDCSGRSRRRAATPVRQP